LEELLFPVRVRTFKSENQAQELAGVGVLNKLCRAINDGGRSLRCRLRKSGLRQQGHATKHEGHNGEPDGLRSKEKPREGEKCRALGSHEMLL
jgi:hypothetical protein